MDEVAQADFRTDAEREACGGVLPRAEVARVAFLATKPLGKRFLVHTRAPGARIWRWLPGLSGKAT